MVVHQRGLVSARLTGWVTRSGIPGAGHHGLVVVDLLVLDPDVVGQATARRFHEAHALAFFGPGGRVPHLLVVNRQVAGLDVRHQLVQPDRHLVGDDLGFQRARRSASQGREHRIKRYVELFQHSTGQFLGRLVAGGIQHQHAGQGSDFHRMTFPARRFEPGVAALYIQMLVRRFGAGVVEIGFTIVGVQPRVLAGGVVVP